MLALTSHPELEREWESDQRRDKGKGCSEESAFHVVYAGVVRAVALVKVVMLCQG